MKSSFASSLLLVVSVARASTLEDVKRCLDATDLACAEVAVQAVGDGAGGDEARAMVAFHRAEFAEARRLYDAAAARAPDNAELAADVQLARLTDAATAGFATERRGDVEVRYEPGTDLVLLDEAIETLQAAKDRVAPLLGGGPPGPIRLEIYPTAERFIAASSLPKDAVEQTGVVALSKWTRLLLTSPRALGRGYAWKDTIVHEYIHLVVAWQTGDQAPVWLQEGIARAHEALWRSAAPSPPPPYAQGLLAEALRGDAFVPTEKFARSMAYLDSPQEAALAFAQVQTQVLHLRDTRGPESIPRVLARVRAGEDAADAVAGEAGIDWSAFVQSWKGSLRQYAQVENLAAMPTVVGAEDEFGIDPVLANRRDLAGHVRLGDLLRDADHMEAALAEYHRGMPAGEPASPLLIARMALALDAVGRTDEAITRLFACVEDYPEVALTRKTLGGLLVKRGRLEDARVQFRASADTNPFDPAVQAALADLYAREGEDVLAARHTRYRRILDLGGTDPVGDPN